MNGVSVKAIRAIDNNGRYLYNIGRNHVEGQMGSLIGISILAFVAIFCMCGVDAFAQQANRSYANAQDLYNRYHRNQQTLNQINERIRMNEGRLRQIRRDYANVALSTGSGGLVGGMHEETAPILAALDRDRILAAQMQRKQDMINTSFNKFYGTYYGNLKETYNSAIYDPKTRTNVNKMGSRIDKFRNPDGTRSVYSSSKKSTQTGYKSSSGYNKSSSGYKSSSTRNTSKSSATGHTMTLTPVK
jgi:hypothetical protein